MIPLADYEQHMSSANVRQLGPLAELFAEVVALCNPSSIAILGIGGGNGLDRIPPSGTSRIVGIDINPSYLDAVRQRYDKVFDLELHCIDLAEGLINAEPVQLVHAALVFEHAGVGKCLQNAISLVSHDGFLSVILQLPGTNTAKMVGDSGIESVRALEQQFALIEPATLRDAVRGYGFRVAHEKLYSLDRGKGLWMGVFARERGGQPPRRKVSDRSDQADGRSHAECQSDHQREPDQPR